MPARGALEKGQDLERDAVKSGCGRVEKDGRASGQGVAVFGRNSG